MKLSRLGSEPSQRIIISGVSYINHGKYAERAQHPPYTKKKGSKAIASSIHLNFQTNNAQKIPLWLPIWELFLIQNKISGSGEHPNGPECDRKPLKKTPKTTPSNTFWFVTTFTNSPGKCERCSGYFQSHDCWQMAGVSQVLFKD